MPLPIKTLALYTTVYPGVEPYLKEWYRSVLAQTDQDYRLWVGVDALGVEAVKSAAGAEIEAEWVVAAGRQTPAQIRQKALARVVETCDAVVLVDSDDVLHASRVKAARDTLQAGDLVGCALRLVDQQGRDLSATFGLPPCTSANEIFPRNNVYGLSNSAFRSDLLRKCLPIPKEAVLVDWFLSTKAWLLGARLSFDPVARMDYRQHGANMARVRAPFHSGQVAQDTERVREHIRLIRTLPVQGFIFERLQLLEKTADEIELFHRKVARVPERLDAYVRTLNELNPDPLWWACVANPALSQMWVS